MEGVLSKQLIVNADDYGLAPGVVQGILKTYHEGTVTSTTVMMNRPGAVDALHQARQEPGLGLGVHLVFTAGRPVSPPEKVPNLVDDNGLFWRVDAWQARLERIDLVQLRTEWEAQLALFRDLAGEPDHLDCHHFLHVYPPIFEVYLSLARHERLPARVPFAVGTQRDERTAAFAADFGISSEVVEAILVADRQLLSAYPVRRPDHFIGGFFGDAKISLEHLLSILEKVDEGITELMVHPGLCDDALRDASGYNWQRERELEILCHPAVRERLTELDITLTNYRILA